VFGCLYNFQSAAWPSLDHGQTEIVLEPEWAAEVLEFALSIVPPDLVDKPLRSLVKDRLLPMFPFDPVTADGGALPLVRAIDGHVLPMAVGEQPAVATIRIAKFMPVAPGSPEGTRICRQLYRVCAERDTELWLKHKAGADAAGLVEEGQAITAWLLADLCHNPGRVASWQDLGSVHAKSVFRMLDCDPRDGAPDASKAMRWATNCLEHAMARGMNNPATLQLYAVMVLTAYTRHAWFLHRAPADRDDALESLLLFQSDGAAVAEWQPPDGCSAADVERYQRRRHIALTIHQRNSVLRRQIAERQDAVAAAACTPLFPRCPETLEFAQDILRRFMLPDGAGGWEPLYLAGKVAAKRGDLTAALQYLQAALARAPTDLSSLRVGDRDDRKAIVVGCCYRLVRTAAKAMLQGELSAAHCEAIALECGGATSAPPLELSLATEATPAVLRAWNAVWNAMQNLLRLFDTHHRIIYALADLALRGLEGHVASDPWTACELLSRCIDPRKAGMWQMWRLGSYDGPLDMPGSFVSHCRRVFVRYIGVLQQCAGLALDAADDSGNGVAAVCGGDGGIVDHAAVSAAAAAAGDAGMGSAGNGGATVDTATNGWLAHYDTLFALLQRLQKQQALMLHRRRALLYLRRADAAECYELAATACRGVLLRAAMSAPTGSDSSSVGTSEAAGEGAAMRKESLDGGPATSMLVDTVPADGRQPPDAGDTAIADESLDAVIAATGPLDDVASRTREQAAAGHVSGIPTRAKELYRYLEKHRPALLVGWPASLLLHATGGGTIGTTTDGLTSLTDPPAC